MSANHGKWECEMGKWKKKVKEKRKRAGGVLLSHGRVPHYPRRWGA